MKRNLNGRVATENTSTQNNTPNGRSHVIARVSKREEIRTIKFAHDVKVSQNVAPGTGTCLVKMRVNFFLAIIIKLREKQFLKIISKLSLGCLEGTRRCLKSIPTRDNCFQSPTYHGLSDH